MNLLLKTCRDGEAGFQACAEAISDDALRRVFEQLAGDCARAAEELKPLIERHGGSPDDATSLVGNVHRGWVHAAGALTGKSDRAVLVECERGEDVALRDYRLALQQDLPADVWQVIEHQFRGAQRNHDQIKALRDEKLGTAQAAGGEPGLGAQESEAAGRQGAGGRMMQWSLAQIRLHPVRALGLLALAGVVGWRAVTPRSAAVSGWLRRRH